MRIIIIILLYIAGIASTVQGQTREISGRVLEKKDKSPVSYATVSIPAHGLWAVTGIDGQFVIKGVPTGKVEIMATCLGHVKQSVELRVARDTAGIVILMEEESLLLETIEVTAKRKQEEMATSYTIDRSALEHMQLLQLTDVVSLLPGGSTNRAVHLASGAQRVALRGASGEMGNVTFGTAVEVDGVRLSTNAAFDGSNGPDTRNISSSNIESVEVITGIPSVEHGDMTQGVVKINTRAGVSPFIIETSTKPHTKLVSVNKGASIGRRGGVLNISLEHARSISDPASPYTSYERNGLSLAYSLAWKGRGDIPFRLKAGATGNAGGYHSKSDPDAFTGTYSRERDHALRGHASFDWLPGKAWITAVEASATINYSNRRVESRSRKSGASSTVAIHGLEEGYFIATSHEEDPAAPVLYIPAGYWYELAITDSKPLNFSGNLRARWFHAIGDADHSLVAGAEYTATGNLGRGLYYDDPRLAPTWRPYRYDEVPFMHTIALHVEEGIRLSRLRVTAGLRSDIALVRGSEYGGTRSLSPRVNAKYVITRDEGFVRDMTIRVGWGKSVKLPSFSTLYPTPSYTDRLAFAPGTLDDGTTFYAYHVMPKLSARNPGLRWQYSTRQEIGIEGKAGGCTASLVFFRGVNHRSYTGVVTYTPFTYKLTDQSAVETSAIPSANRRYTVDRATGIVTVMDKSGALPPEQLAYRELNTFSSRGMPVNGSPSTRWGIEWVIDFGKIRVLNTSIRWDGSFYAYRGVEETITASMPNSTQQMSNGQPYQYVGYYAGSSTTSNGSEKRRVSSNASVVTRIPAARLVFSLRVEATLYNYSRNLSEHEGRQRGFVLDNAGDYMPSATETDIYGGNRYVGIYPLYYTSFDDMETKIPFAEKFAWARENDATLYNDLAKLVARSNYLFTFNKDRVSASLAANINVTKEIGEFASISFNATNATRNMGRVSSTWTNSESSLYNSSLVPTFYYGLSLRLKL
ncbi:MAG: carboxypeptidase-like regulatory domain-containing protein [Odoribacteraceae bacterium]|nr:carboxypeptidase-like regulatory domain-containing protein [Odoribacteraceae bacterium]